LNAAEFVKVWSCSGDHPKDMTLKVSSSALVRLESAKEWNDLEVQINAHDLQRL
jgi:hypothetical protein